MRQNLGEAGLCLADQNGIGAPAVPRTVGRLFCAVSKRVPRLYMESGQVVERSLRLLPKIE